MSRDHAATARAAFAMASRTELIEGQRAAALNRGLLIVKKYGLDPDDFDIPGRERKPKPINGKRPTIAIHDEFPEEGFLERMFEQMRRQAVEQMRRKAAEDLFRQTQRAEQMKVRTEATILGRDRVRIVRNDGC